MAKGDTWIVTSTTLSYKNGPGNNYTVSGYFSKNTQFIESGSSGTWIQHSLGWSNVGTNGQYASIYKTATDATVVTEDPSAPTQEEIDGSGYRPDVETITSMAGTSYADSLKDDDIFYRTKSILGIFGMPYQFLPNADPRMNTDSNPYDGGDNELGIEYSDRIVSKIPLLFLAPGRPSFMTKYSTSEKKNILEALIKGEVGDTKSSLEGLLNSDGRYYTFEYANTEYYQYVNPMCRIAARYLEIQDIDLDGKKLDELDWSTYTMGNTLNMNNLTTYGHIPFYLDSETSVSEDFGNGLTESSLTSTINGISDLGREINFITGYSASALDSDWLKNNADITDLAENMSDMVNSMLGKNSMLTSLTKHLTTVASGGRLMFPKIWSDSDFSRSYNVKVKLVSPDCNKLSIFLNVLVPLFHLIGLVAPQTDSENPNGYTSPFIIRALYKSFFNVDMGIITSMSVDKGGDCQWTVDGLPTSIEVSFTIKDLYECMGITRSSADKWKYDTLSNTAQMDYIANLCGINMYVPEIGRQLSMWYVNEKNKITGIPKDIWRNINISISSKISNLFRR